MEYQPPWKKYPDKKASSMAWRMGEGEDYYNIFYQWYSSLNAVEQSYYAVEHPEPRQWRGFYKTIIDHPWTV